MASSAKAWAIRARRNCRCASSSNEAGARHTKAIIQERGATAPLFAFRPFEEATERSQFTHPFSTPLAFAAEIPHNLKFSHPSFSTLTRSLSPQENQAKYQSLTI